MERRDLSELSRSIEAAQSRLAATVGELRHESQPKVIAGHAAHNASVKAKALVMTEAGAVRIEAIVAGVVAVAGVSALILFSRRR